MALVSSSVVWLLVSGCGFFASAPTPEPEPPVSDGPVLVLRPEFVPVRTAIDGATDAASFARAFAMVEAKVSGVAALGDGRAWRTGISTYDTMADELAVLLDAAASKMKALSVPADYPKRLAALRRAAIDDTYDGCAQTIAREKQDELPNVELIAHLARIAAGVEGQASAEARNRWTSAIGIPASSLTTVDAVTAKLVAP